MPPNVTSTSTSELPAAENLAFSELTAWRTSESDGLPATDVATPEMKVSSVSFGAIIVMCGSNSTSTGASVPPTSMITGLPHFLAAFATS
eukprot:2634740-Pleurochrysis_carterae.AAC.2